MLPLYATRYALRVPDRGDLGPILLSLWLVQEGEAVQAGDRVAELLAGPATYDLASPIAGRLSQCLVDESQEVQTGQTLAWIDEAE